MWSLHELWVWEHFLWMLYQLLFRICLWLKTPTGQVATKLWSPETAKMGREWGKSSCWGCWGTLGRRQRNCGLAVWVWQKGGGVGSRLWGWEPWEKSGKHCHNLWKLWRKVLLHLVIIPLMSILIRSVWWWSPFDMDTGCIDLGTAATGHIDVAQEKCPHLLVPPGESRKILKSNGTENDKGFRNTVCWERCTPTSWRIW